MNFKFSILFFALAVIMLSSCKDAILEESNKIKLTGTWQADSFSQANCNDADDNASFTFDENGQSCDDYIVAEVCVEIDFTFSPTEVLAAVITATSSNPALVPSSTENIAGTWEILDETRMTVCLDGTCSTGTYTVTSSKLTYSGNDADTGCDISITATKQ